MLRRGWIMPVLAVAVVANTVPGVARAASLDGNWSVLVVTEKGTCDKAYRYEVAVGGGKVRFTGNQSIDLSGTVDGTGRVQVSISRGSQSAKGTGRLAANSGSGTWTGQSSQQQCSGHWQAERR